MSVKGAFWQVLPPTQLRLRMIDSQDHRRGAQLRPCLSSGSPRLDRDCPPEGWATLKRNLAAVLVSVTEKLQHALKLSTGCRNVALPSSRQNDYHACQSVESASLSMPHTVSQSKHRTWIARGVGFNTATRVERHCGQASMIG